jgi:hypothetical protein
VPCALRVADFGFWGPAIDAFALALDQAESSFYDPTGNRLRHRVMIGRVLFNGWTDWPSPLAAKPPRFKNRGHPRGRSHSSGRASASWT